MDHNGQYWSLVNWAVKSGPIARLFDLTFVFLIISLAGGATAACRQALALGIDVSGSVDQGEYAVQIQGLAGALNTPEVRDMMVVAGSAPVRLAIYEWSGPQDQHLILDWFEIGDEAALDQVIARLLTHQRPKAQPTTAIGEALLMGVAMLETQSDCWKLTLDLSGDGKTNSGRRPQDIPDDQTPPNITINGLVIGASDGNAARSQLIEASELQRYYEAFVIRGPGAFVEQAIGFDDYLEAMKRKLLRELQSMAIGSGPDERGYAGMLPRG